LQSSSTAARSAGPKGFRKKTAEIITGKQRNGPLSHLFFFRLAFGTKDSLAVSEGKL